MKDSHTSFPYEDIIALPHPTSVKPVSYTHLDVYKRQTGGGGIKWVVDEARFAGTQLDPSSGHLYKIVDWGTAVSWDTANQRAQSLDSELGMTGYLAEITSATENSVVSGLLGNRNAWLGGKRLSSGSWRWNKSNTTFGYTNWASGAQTTNANLYMKLSLIHICRWTHSHLRQLKKFSATALS